MTAEQWKTYTTRNGSVAVCVQTCNSGLRGKYKILKGGHGVEGFGGASEENPYYWLTPSRYYKLPETTALDGVGIQYTATPKIPRWKRAIDYVMRKVKEATK